MFTEHLRNTKQTEFFRTLLSLEMIEQKEWTKPHANKINIPYHRIWDYFNPYFVYYELFFIN